jgi:putative hydrolase of the HAD superfamily
MLEGSNVSTDPVVVVFDLGGVVCGFVPERRLAALVELSGCSADHVRSRVLEAPFNHDCDCGRYTVSEACAFIRDALGVDATDVEIQDRWVQAFEPDPACVGLLAELQPGLARALLTDNGPLLLDGFGQRLPAVADAFDHLVFSCTVGATKPDLRLFAYVERLVGRRGREIVFVDDSARNVNAAVDFGWDAIRFDTIAEVEAALMTRGLLAR